MTNFTVSSESSFMQGLSKVEAVAFYLDCKKIGENPKIFETKFIEEEPFFQDRELREEEIKPYIDLYK